MIIDGILMDDWVPGFVEWHEGVISQYPSEVRQELTWTREKWLKQHGKRSK